MRATDIFRYRNTLILGLCLLTGCATQSPLPPSTSDSIASIAGDAPVPALRQGRYTLVELRPEFSQQDLQHQIIDMRIPATPTTTVGDAMRYVLLRSGYQLCDGNAVLQALWTLPLPAAHLQLGPLPLNQSLQLLAGNAWRLSVDEHERKVCFIAEEAQR